MLVNIQTVESMPFAENSYILWVEGSSEALIVDPGFEPDLILDVIRQKQLTPVAILNTHGHVDHIAGNKAMKTYFPDAPLLIGSGDAPMLTDPMRNLSGPFGFHIVSPPADRLVNAGDILQYAGMELLVHEIPGHSPGHVVYAITAAEPPILLGGDVLFAGGIGRWDFPGGSQQQLLDGIRTKLWPLPAATRVFPGHGPSTTIGTERTTNPFVAES
ncbi:MAG: MBL fold metallo-hydrolase [Bacteroidales bacterium]|nr:MBL fold metallo-hydrolase [Bacteroidales bacterium]